MSAEDDEKFNHLLERNQVLLNTVLEAVEDVDPTEVGHLAGHEHFDGLVVEAYSNNENPTVEELNDLWIHAPGMVFFAQRVMWTDLEPPAPTEDSWLVTIVLPDKPAIFFAKNVMDELWSPFPAPNAPWFAVSTAHAMRCAQSDGTPIPPLRTAENADVFKTPEQLLMPPVDEEGIIG
jgi:hypothetical protein